MQIESSNPPTENCTMTYPTLRVNLEDSLCSADPHSLSSNLRPLLCLSPELLKHLQRSLPPLPADKCLDAQPLGTLPTLASAITTKLRVLKQNHNLTACRLTSPLTSGTSSEASISLSLVSAPFSLHQQRPALSALEKWQELVRAMAPQNRNRQGSRGQRDRAGERGLLRA